MAACFNMLTINLVVRREMGLLKRVRLSPLPTWAMMAAVSANALIISAVQVVLVLLIGRFGYDVPFPHNLAAFIVALLVGAASFTALGLGVSTLIPNQEAGAPVTSIVFFVLLFLSGLWFPLPRVGAGEVLVLPARPAHDRRCLRRVDRPEGNVELAVARHPRHGDLGCRVGSRGGAALELGSAPGQRGR
jgi:ABC-2 type transport system permease protein